MQAQEPRPPFIGLWSRLRGFAREDLPRALHEREIVRGDAHARHAAPVQRRRLRQLPPDLAAGADAGDGRCWASGRRGWKRTRSSPWRRSLLQEEPRTFGELRAAPGGAISRRQRTRAGVCRAHAAAAGHDAHGASLGVPGRFPVRARRRRGWADRWPATRRWRSWCGATWRRSVRRR